MILFPDTSNMWYQSHCKAGAVILLYFPLFTEFLELGWDKNDSWSFYHLESNVYHGLWDIPTLMELAILVLYAQSISQPYMQQVRCPEQVHKNVLDFGPMHKQVKVHCKKIIVDPDLLLSSSTTYTTGILDGKLWEQPEAIYRTGEMCSVEPCVPLALITAVKSLSKPSAKNHTSL